MFTGPEFWEHLVGFPQEKQQNTEFTKFSPVRNRSLVSHCCAIGDTMSCDAPYSAIGFGGKLFLRYPPSKACLWIAIGHFYGKRWGCSSDSLRHHRKHSATGVYLQWFYTCLAIGGVSRSGHYKTPRIYWSWCFRIGPDQMSSDRVLKCKSSSLNFVKEIRRFFSKNHLKLAKHRLKKCAKHRLKLAKHRRK